MELILPPVVVPRSTPRFAPGERTARVEIDPTAVFEARWEDVVPVAERDRPEPPPLCERQRPNRGLDQQPPGISKARPIQCHRAVGDDEEEAHEHERIGQRGRLPHAGGRLLGLCRAPALPERSRQEWNPGHRHHVFEQPEVHRATDSQAVKRDHPEREHRPDRIRPPRNEHEQRRSGLEDQRQQRERAKQRRPLEQCASESRCDTFDRERVPNRSQLGPAGALELEDDREEVDQGDLKKKCGRCGRENPLRRARRTRPRWKRQEDRPEQQQAEDHVASVNDQRLAVLHGDQQDPRDQRCESGSIAEEECRCGERGQREHPRRKRYVSTEQVQ